MFWQKTFDWQVYLDDQVIGMASIISADTINKIALLLPWQSSVYLASLPESPLICLSVLGASALLTSVHEWLASRLHVAGFPGLPGADTADCTLTPYDLLSIMFWRMCVCWSVGQRQTERKRVNINVSPLNSDDDDCLGGLLVWWSSHSPTIINDNVRAGYEAAAGHKRL